MPAGVTAKQVRGGHSAGGGRKADRPAPATRTASPVARGEAFAGSGIEDEVVSAAVGRRRLVLVLAGFLYLFGLVMVTSSSSGTSLLNGSSEWQYLQRQLIFGVLGFAGLLFALHVRLSFVQRMAWPLLVVGTLGLLVIFVPGLGHTANGATRWINLGPFQFQPSEVVKLALIIYISDHLARTPPPVHWYRDFVRSPGGIGLGLAALIFVQRDLGSAMISGGVVLTLYMLAGTNWRLLFSTIGPAIALVVLGIVSEPYRRERFLAFLDPWGDPHGPGYQLVQALIAIGSGGPWGVGLGHSVQKIHFLPEAHTDMIFSIVAEELGFVGVATVIVSFSMLAVIGARIALKAADRFQSLLAAGATAMLVGQAGLNVAGVVGVLPLTGVPLPLISYGGSNLLISLTAFGLLANIATAQQHGQQTAGSGGRADARTAEAASSGRGGRHGRASGAGARGRRQPA